MDLKHIIVLLMTHGLPILFFMYMATDLLLRNKRKTEHILLSLIAVCFLLLFIEEFVRNIVSIEYSPMLSMIWLSSVGILIPALCFHFLIKFTGLYTSWPRFLYPIVFYIPVVLVVLSIGMGTVYTQSFTEIGLWKYPVYNKEYYAMMIFSTAIDGLYLLPLFIAKSRSKFAEQVAVYKQLIIGVYVAILLNIGLGFFHLEAILPPYPFIYAGIFWCYFLRRIMKRYDFLTLYDKRYEKLFCLNPNAIVLLDFQGVILEANPAATELLRRLNPEQKPFFSLLNEELTQELLNEQEIKEYAWNGSVDNEAFYLLVNADYVLVDNQLAILLLLQNVTLQKQYQQEIEFLAYHDTLTRLPNRRLFTKQIEEAMAEQTPSQSLTLFLTDIDNFKQLNDTYGHQAGDELLQATAEILQRSVDNVLDVARLGGDEFVLFIQDCTSEKELRQFIQQIQAIFSQHITQTHPDLPIALSIGTSQFPKDGQDLQTLMHHADQAMYLAKRMTKKTN